MRHLISALVENQFGVLARIAGMFSSPGYNIDSLAVGETVDPTVSRVTIVTHGDDVVIEQIIKQMRKLIDVIRVLDLTEESHVERELVLVKVACDKTSRGEIMQVVSIFRARIIDVSPSSMVVEVVGTQDKIEALLDQFKPYGIMEVVRTGAIGLFRGTKVLKI
jgi:acetolactate synthase-1/3 small subunit